MRIRRTGFGGCWPRCGERRRPRARRSAWRSPGGIHIALWDVLRACSIEGADDGSIRQPEINDLRRVLDRADIRAIFTTGTKAAALYRRYCLPVTGRPAIPLPSTSPANCRATLDDLTQAYRAILAYI